MKNSRKTQAGIVSAIFFALLFPLLSFVFQSAFYKYYPITYWIDFISMELQDTVPGNYQILYSTRRINEPILADFSYKTFCTNEDGAYRTASDKFFTQYDVPLHPTNGEIRTVEVEMNLPYILSPGECTTKISIFSDIHGVQRPIGAFETNYTVHEK